MQGFYVKTQPGQLRPKYRIRCHYNIFYVCERADDIEPTEPNAVAYRILEPSHPTYAAALARVRQLNLADRANRGYQPPQSTDTPTADKPKPPIG